ncbi:MAG: 50S ribosomal protein L15 [Elusimicrobia bacterium]|nr:50S ribosomal protein L15 [Elusimicrobiota bacterium]
MNTLSLDDLKPSSVSRKKKVRRGRGIGSGCGRTSGRGRGGSGHRSGNARKPGFEGGQMPLIRRIPKRGFNNKRFAEELEIVNISEINKRFKSGDTVDPKKLAEAGIVRSERPVKILGNGELKKKINVSGCRLSASARQKIQEAGGEIAK